MLHLNLTLLLGRQRTHDGRLDNGHEGHVRIGSHGDGAEKMWSQFGGEENSCGTVSTTDNADGSGFFHVEAHEIELHEEEGGEDTQLCGSAEEETLRVGNQGSEVGHRTHTEEDEAGIYTHLHANVEDVEQTTLSHDMTIAVVERTLLIQELIVPHLRVEQARCRDVAEQHTEGDGQEQQGLVLLLDGQIEQQAGDADHHGILPAIFCEELHKTHVVPELRHRRGEVEVLGLKRKREHEQHEQQQTHPPAPPL